MSSFDITFCANHTCKKRENCERNSDRLKDYPYPVSMAGFAPDENGECEYFCTLDENEESEEEDDIIFDRDENGVVRIYDNQEP